MIVTQTSLTPDLHQARPVSPSIQANGARTGAKLEATLWLIALTATGLVMAAVLLLGLLVGNVVRDASVGGLASGVAVVIATLGLGALAYVLVTARREGWLGSPENAPVPAALPTPSGMHIVPAVPADPARHKRREMQDERLARSEQAQAIAAPARSQPGPRPAIRMPRPPDQSPRPVAWPMGAPVVRMGYPRMHPHTQAALFQVNAASVRTPAPAWRR